ncbi:MAG TPA: AbrB/MazE/SpoVT family DNA-binding domain-containing protein [Candidatus Nanoarchaeia archaeon]|nr:AbrB/MazE/SpoVT family DNA-binding domain-containing protein [Candidatus Nanoarchaeia archaeon]
METVRTKKWGSSLGVVIPKAMAQQLGLVENQDILIDIEPRTNVLKELFGFAKNKVRKDTERIIHEARKDLGVD